MSIREIRVAGLGGLDDYGDDDDDQKQQPQIEPTSTTKESKRGDMTMDIKPSGGFTPIGGDDKGYAKFDLDNQMDTRSERCLTNADRRSNHQLEESKRIDSEDHRSSMNLSDGASGAQSSRFNKFAKNETGRVSFSKKLSKKIDDLIEGYKANAEPRELFIPGLDDENKE